MVMNSVAAPHSEACTLQSSPVQGPWFLPLYGAFLPATSQARRTRTRFSVAATSNEGDETEDLVTSTTEDTKTSPAAQNSVSEKRAIAEAEAKKGQSSAIVPGAISASLGVGYLVPVQLLDTRSVILVPPPPEAFKP